MESTDCWPGNIFRSRSDSFPPPRPTSSFQYRFLIWWIVLPVNRQGWAFDALPGWEGGHMEVGGFCFAFLWRSIGLAKHLLMLREEIWCWRKTEGWKSILYFLIFPTQWDSLLFLHHVCATMKTYLYSCQLLYFCYFLPWWFRGITAVGWP